MGLQQGWIVFIMNENNMPKDFIDNENYLSLCIYE